MQIGITHFIMEFYACQAPLSDSKFITNALLHAIKQTNLTKLHCYSHRFQPTGVTAVVVLKESHVAIHTWPEHDYAAIDLFTCGSKEQARKACQNLAESLKPGRVKRREIVRGIQQ